MTLLQLRHHLIMAGFVGTGLVAASSLTVWPQADAARVGTGTERSIAAQPAHAVASIGTRNPTPQQVPLSALAFNPFAARSAATRPADGDRLQLLESIRKLRLDSALCSESHRGCSISGNALAEGESVGPFIVEKISPASVTLKSGAYRFELRLQP